MNILVMSWRDPKHPLSGGAEQVMHEHMKGWVEAGHEVTLFSSRFKNSKKNEILDGIEIIRYGNQLGTVFIAAFFWYLFVKHEKFDLIVDQFHGIPFFSPLYIRVPKLAVIQEVTREVWFKNELTFPLNWIYAVVGFTLEPLIFFLYKNIFFMTGSNSAKKDLIKMGIKDKNIKVIPHGVIIKKQKKRYKKERIKTVIFLGALAKDKGIEDALKAFSLLEKKDKYQFWIVGKGSPDYVLQLRKMTKNIQDITFFGFVTIERKFELLSRAHILINPL